MKKLTVLFIGSVLWLACKDNKPIIIKPFKLMDSIDTVKDVKRIFFNRRDFFLIEEYKDNKRYNNFIDSFLKANKIAEWINYSNYTMTIYKETKNTNLTGNKYSLSRDKYKKYTNDNDLLFAYTWSRNGLLQIDTFKNGEIINKLDARVKISDVKNRIKTGPD